MQAASASFSETPLGHAFVLRRLLAKATANKCAECAADIRDHARCEVTDEQLLAVLNVQDDGKASVILPGELAVGSYKAILAVAKQADGIAVINAAGKKLHEFLPATRGPFDELRKVGRLFDCEWEDSEDFEIPLTDIEEAFAFAKTHVAAGRMVIINCAQGKSRSGTMAVAYIVAKAKLPVMQALSFVRQHRPLVQPNPVIACLTLLSDFSYCRFFKNFTRMPFLTSELSYISPCPRADIHANAAELRGRAAEDGSAIICGCQGERNASNVRCRSFGWPQSQRAAPPLSQEWSECERRQAHPRAVRLGHGRRAQRWGTWASMGSGGQGLGDRDEDLDMYYGALQAFKVSFKH